VLTSAATGIPLGAKLNSEPALAIETSDLVKEFGSVRALNGLDLSVPAGIVYGFLGPNGAGKTTTIRTLATLIRPDSGVARVFGHDVVTEPDAVRRLVSLTGQFASVDEALTGVENLVLVARLLGHSWAESRTRADQLLVAFGIEHAANRLVSGYSGGMRRRLDIAASIVVSPKLLFLDEPTAGLDPQGRSQVWDTIRALVSVDTTVLLTTQYLEEADALASRIAVIDHGRVIAEGTPSELKASIGSGALHIHLTRAEDRPEAERHLVEALGVPVEPEADPLDLAVRVDDMDRVVQALTHLSRSGIQVASFGVRQPSLDEVFLALTGHRAETEPPLPAAATTKGTA
jgi:ABC-2 type transport system ATP-binding protein